MREAPFGAAPVAQAQPGALADADAAEAVSPETGAPNADAFDSGAFNNGDFDSGAFNAGASETGAADAAGRAGRAGRRSAPRQPWYQVIGPRGSAGAREQSREPLPPSAGASDGDLRGAVAVNPTANPAGIADPAAANPGRAGRAAGNPGMTGRAAASPAGTAGRAAANPAGGNPAEMAGRTALNPPAGMAGPAGAAGRAAANPAAGNPAGPAGLAGRAAGNPAAGNPAGMASPAWAAGRAAGNPAVGNPAGMAGRAAANPATGNRAWSAGRTGHDSRQGQLPFTSPHPEGLPAPAHGDGRANCGPLEKILWRQWTQGTVPHPQAVAAVERLASFPRALQEKLADGLSGIYVGSGGVPELDHMSRLRGVRLPSGRATWDACAGAYGERKIVIGTRPSPTPDVICHEVGHALDDLDGPPGRWQSDSAEFRLIYDQCKPYLASDFHRQRGGLGQKEFFADSFAAIASAQRPALVDMLSGNTRVALRVMLYFNRRYGI